MCQNCQEVVVSREKIGWVGKGGGRAGQRTQEGLCTVGLPYCAQITIASVRWVVGGCWDINQESKVRTRSWILSLGGKDLLKVERL